MENRKGPENHPGYSDCTHAFENSLSNDDLANRDELFADLEELGVHPIIASMIRKLSISDSNESYVEKVAFGLREKWKYEWRKKFPNLAGIEKRVNRLWEDRVSHDPEFLEEMKKETDDMSFDDMEFMEDPDGASTRARDWIALEEGITSKDMEEMEKLKEYYVVSKMAGFLRGVGKEVPAEINEYLEYNSPEPDDFTNQN